MHFGNAAFLNNIYASNNTAIRDSALWNNDITGNALAQIG
jgi:hypothetical protein